MPGAAHARLVEGTAGMCGHWDRDPLCSLALGMQVQPFFPLAVHQPLDFSSRPDLCQDLQGFHAVVSGTVGIGEHGVLNKVCH